MKLAIEDITECLEETIKIATCNGEFYDSDSDRMVEVLGPDISNAQYYLKKLRRLIHLELQEAVEGFK